MEEKEELMSSLGVRLWRFYCLALASRLLGLPQTFLHTVSASAVSNNIFAAVRDTVSLDTFKTVLDISC